MPQSDSNNTPYLFFHEFIEWLQNNQKFENTNQLKEIVLWWLFVTLWKNLQHQGAGRRRSYEVGGE